MKIHLNVGNMDRGVRFGVGLFLLILVFTGAMKGLFGIGLIAVGVIALMTGLSGYCPIYHLTGIDTCRKETDGRAKKAR